MAGDAFGQAGDGPAVDDLLLEDDVAASELPHGLGGAGADHVDDLEALQLRAVAAGDQGQLVGVVALQVHEAVDLPRGRVVAG